MSDAGDAGAGGGGRYARTSGGLVASLVVTALLVIGLVGLRALTSDELEVEPTDIDYLETVGLAQDAGVRPAYPAPLPDGWTVTKVDVGTGESPSFGLSLNTDDGAFVGVRQRDASVEELLDEYVDEDTDELETIEVTGSVAGEWAAYEDGGGDLAYAAQVGVDTVLVFGTAGEAVLRSVLESLTTDPVPVPTPPPAPAP
ncbi:MAG: DUF4245 family protein [Nocardioides sp.]